MELLDDETPYCKKCEYDLDGNLNRDTCPRCQYSPKNKGLRVSLSFVLVMIVVMTVLMFVPSVGTFLLPIAALSFLLAVLTLFVSFLATPYRLGSLFLRL